MEDNRTIKTLIADALDEAQKDYDLNAQGIGLRNFQVSWILRTIGEVSPYRLHEMAKGDTQKYKELMLAHGYLIPKGQRGKVTVDSLVNILMQQEDLRDGEEYVDFMERLAQAIFDELEVK